LSILSWVLLLCFSVTCAQAGGPTSAQQTLANPGETGVSVKAMGKPADWQQLLKYFRDTPVPSNELGVAGPGEKPWLTLCLHHAVHSLSRRCADFGSLWTQKGWTAASPGALDWALDYWSVHSKATLAVHARRGERHVIGAALGWLRDVGVAPRVSVHLHDVTPECQACIDFMGDCLYCLGADCDHCH
jgi:hypothetical protein